MTDLQQIQGTNQLI